MWQLAQINVARFRKPKGDPANAPFLAALDEVNAAAEGAPGFIWRLRGESNDAMDISIENDPDVAVNMSVWTDMPALSAFVYRTPVHRDIMRRRREWFDAMETYLALWWVPAGMFPSLADGLGRLELLGRQGATAAAFTFGTPFAAPGQVPPMPVLDRCA